LKTERNIGAKSFGVSHFPLGVPIGGKHGGEKNINAGGDFKK
jgi:hypothetical protein